VLEWPGSARVYSDDPVLRYKFEYNAEIVDVIASETSEIYEWQSPVLPSDPHLLRRDESVWLGTTITEYWSWLELLPGELEELSDSLPEVGRMLVPGPR